MIRKVAKFARSKAKDLRCQACRSLISEETSQVISADLVEIFKLLSASMFMLLSPLQTLGFLSTTDPLARNMVL